MSRLTSNPILWAPSAESCVPVTTGGTAWTYGDWVPFIAATTAADTAIAGIVFHDSDVWSSAEVQAQFGIGPESGETPIGHIRLAMPSSGNGGPSAYILKYGISGIVVGSRVSVRLSQRLGGASTWLVGVGYYDNPDTDQVIPYTTALLTSFPDGADSISLSPSATPWDPSAWEEFSPAVGEPTYIVGLAPNASTSAVDWEVSVGTGAAAAETVGTSFRGGTYGGGRVNNVNLPGLFPITTGARLVGQLRKSGTEVTAMPVAFLAYTGPLEEEDTGGVIGPIAWVHWPRRVL